MKSRDELGIKYGGTISRYDIRRGDIIEITPNEWDRLNRRYVVDKVLTLSALWIDSLWVKFDDELHTREITDERIIWVIRWFPSDDELRGMGWLSPMRIDYPDYDWQESPVFTEEMREDYEGVNDLLLHVESSPRTRSVMDDYRLYSAGYAFNKRWILWDTLKFYSFNNLSYFI